MAKRKSETLILQTAGGLLSAPLLRQLADTARANGAGRVRATCRQELILDGLPPHRVRDVWSMLPNERFRLDREDHEPNIVTTAPVAGIRPGRDWLTPGVFQDLLADLPFRPQLPVSIADPVQPFLPSRMGQVSFLAMEQPDTWALEVVLPNATDTWRAPGTLHAHDLSPAIERIQRFYLRPTGDPAVELFTRLEDLLRSDNGPVEEVTVPSYAPPGHAASLPMPEDGWPATFLQELAVWALQRDNVTLSLTPWRTLLVRGIEEEDTRTVARLCAVNRIPREASPWHTHVLATPECTADAHALCDALTRVSPTNPGVSLAVTSNAGSLDTHLHLERRRPATLGGLRPARYTLTLRDLDNTRATTAERVIEGLHLPEVTTEILAWLDLRSALLAPPESVPATPMETKPAPTHDHHTCMDCLTVYDSDFGDPLAHIAPGVPFESLPDEWQCPTCGAPATQFTAA